MLDCPDEHCDVCDRGWFGLVSHGATTTAMVVDRPGVTEHMLRTRLHGGQASADVHVLVDPQVSVSEGHMISLLVERRLKREIDEIADVTVHIDPEDDERAPPTDALPLRAEALARLASAWSHIPAATERTRVVLHYLSGVIQVDVFLPMAAVLRPGAQPEVLRSSLQEALSAHPEFGTVRVYYGD